MGAQGDRFKSLEERVAKLEAEVAKLKRAAAATATAKGQQ